MTQKEMFGNAQWVKASDCHVVSPSIRGTFEAENTKDGEITICGLGFFELYINGERISDDLFVPVDSHYHHYDDCHCYKAHGEELAFRIYCVKYDISAYLRKGKNAVAVVLGPGWHQPYGECMLCYKIDLRGKTVVSDASLRWRESPISEYVLTKGERQDYLKCNYLDGWMLPDYCDDGWKKVDVTDAPESRFYIQECPPDRIIRSVSPKLINETDEFRVYDLGENITGWPVLRCNERGAELSIRVSEEINGDLTLNEKWNHGQRSVFVTDGADREYHLRFTWAACRYIEVSKNAELLRFDVIHADIPVTSSFESDNKVLNWYYDAYVRTQLCNMHAGIPSDCPQIERRGYTGDGQLVCETAMLLFGDRGFYLKWMEDISDCQDRKSGHVQYTAPYTHCGGGPGGWGCAIVEVPYIFYRTFGDAEPMKKYFPQMLRYFDYLEAHSKDDLVIDDQPGEWHLGEWCVPGSESGKLPDVPEPFVNNYFYIKSLNRVMEIAGVIGKENIIPQLQAVKERKIAAVMREYYDEGTGVFAGNKNSANAFALDLGLGGRKTLQYFADALDKTGVLDTGIFGTDIALRVLFENGYDELAFRLFSSEGLPSFGHMMSRNATTLWEDWDTPRSMSHPMFGAAVRYLFNYMLGIRQAGDSCGYEKILIAPADIPSLGYVSGSVTTVAGRISVTIDRKKGRAEVVIPEGAKAVFRHQGKNSALNSGLNILSI